MKLSIPRRSLYSVWREQFLSCNVQELTQALKDCELQVIVSCKEDNMLESLVYGDVWPKLIQKRIQELIEEKCKVTYDSV